MYRRNNGIFYAKDKINDSYRSSESRRRQVRGGDTLFHDPGKKAVIETVGSRQIDDLPPRPNLRRGLG